ncbi:LysR family transcriptional regulator [Aquitalea aquatica]|uniref:LysR family transcriptional regulator n=1 Tax=Aquitalea aquatica TaxID=3044273 RepID=A0A838YCM2_9NEIS|nr:LysR family transcriptional regulator [Aquitalea magnusonii]MBA4708805.1 LysR family transcriptional regulator [Aquitalea magnusonii]
MARENLNDLRTFVLVAREGSFTRAAAKLGVSPSAVSHTMRGLEESLGMRLVTRTTRSVALTTAGEQVLAIFAPRLDEIEAELSVLREQRDKPAGSIRITATDFSAEQYLLPKLAQLLPDYPDVQVELSIDYGLTDIVAQRFDAGIRFGDQVARDMIAVRISPDIQTTVVATPAYFARYGVPAHPRELTEHNCISMRLPTYGGLYAWEFAQGEHKFSIRVGGQLIINTLPQMLNAALSGMGIAYTARDYVQPYLADGRLQEVLQPWCAMFPGFHLYYPSRRQSSRALMLLVDALRYHASQA